MLVDFQKELQVNFGRLVSISVDSPRVLSAFRAGLGATWPFFSDENRELITSLGILDETEGEYAYTAQPYTFICNPDLRIRKIYDGWFFVGRPTAEELRQDLRRIMSEQDYYPYEAWNTEGRKQLRVPQHFWATGRPLGASGNPVSEGFVLHFDKQSGNGMIVDEQDDQKLFFNFTTIPGEGYRTISAQTRVKFEIVETATGKSALNIQID